MGRLDDFLGHGQQGRIDQHHGDADVLPNRNEGDGQQGRRFLAQPRREVAANAHAIHQRLAHTPQRRQDQLPDEADDDDGQQGGQEDQGAVAALALQTLEAEEGGQQQADGILQQHVDEEKLAVVPHRIPETLRPLRVEQDGGVVGQAGKMVLAALIGRVQAQAQGIGQGQGAEQRVNDQRRGQEHEHVPWESFFHGETPDEEKHRRRGRRQNRATGCRIALLRPVARGG
ncbi:hypothetical protein D3C72_1313290 [compost metagenome]